MGILNNNLSTKNNFRSVCSLSTYTISMTSTDFQTYIASVNMSKLQATSLKHLHFRKLFAFCMQKFKSRVSSQFISLLQIFDIITYLLQMFFLY